MKKFKFVHNIDYSLVKLSNQVPRNRNSFLSAASRVARVTWDETSTYSFDSPSNCKTAMSTVEEILAKVLEPDNESIKTVNLCLY